MSEVRSSSTFQVYVETAGKKGKPPKKARVMIECGDGPIVVRVGNGSTADGWRQLGPSEALPEDLDSAVFHVLGRMLASLTTRARLAEVSERLDKVGTQP